MLTKQKRFRVIECNFIIVDFFQDLAGGQHAGPELVSETEERLGQTDMKQVWLMGIQQIVKTVNLGFRHVLSFT